MNKQIEHILLSILASLSVLLGLTFWLNIRFGFNLFSSEHWQELASIQASNTYIDKTFYISIFVAVFILIFFLYLINRPRFVHHHKKTITPIQSTPVVSTVKKTDIKESTPTQNIQQENTPNIVAPQIPEPEAKPQSTINDMFLSRPPQLNLPKNIEQIAAQQYEQLKNQPQYQNENKPTIVRNDQYDKEIAETFSNCAYLVKPNPTIAGLKTNLFAIGNKEVVWIGCVDCDINKLKSAIEQLKSTFKETLEDIPITVYSFLLDTNNLYSSDENIFVFHNLDDLKKFILDNQGLDIPESDQDDFNAYSEYIDTIINLLYKG